MPNEQEIVVIEDVVLLLGLDIGREQLAQLFLPDRAPWEVAPQHVIERRFGIHGARIDRKAGPFGRKPALGLREAEIVPEQVHQVGGILAIVNREIGIEPDLVSIVAQQPRADAVEGAGPGQRVSHDVGALPMTRRAIRSTRRVVWAAARRENVISRIRRGSAPLTIR